MLVIVLFSYVHLYVRSCNMFWQESAKVDYIQKEIWFLLYKVRIAMSRRKKKNSNESFKNR